MNDGTSNPARYFGRQVRRARRAAGWTLTEFGQRIGYDPGQISRIENGSALEFAERIRRIPVYPVAAGYDPRRRRRDARVERDAVRADGSRSSRPSTRVIAGALNRYPDPSYAPLRTALSDRYGIPASGSRSAMVPATSCCRRRGAARAGRRGRVCVAGVQRLPAPRSRPPARARSRSRSTRRAATT